MQARVVVALTKPRAPTSNEAITIPIALASMVIIGKAIMAAKRTGREATVAVREVAIKIETTGTTTGTTIIIVIRVAVATAREVEAAIKTGTTTRIIISMATHRP